MLKNLSLHFRGKKHRRSDISDEILYKNRLKKSVFIVLGLIGCFLVSQFNFYFHYELGVPLLLLLDFVNVIVTVFFLLGLFLLPYHPKHYGLNFNKPAENMAVGLGAGILLALLVVGLRMVLFQKGHFEYGFNPKVKISYFIYPIFVLAQEMVVKGYFQSYFIALFDNRRYAKIAAVLIGALVFAQFHLILGIPVFLFTFVYGVITGFLYERTRSIVGVSLLHFFGGFTLLNFSNFYL